MDGEDTAAGTAHVTDEEIRAVIDHYDDPEHPDALDVTAVRGSMADLQAAVVAAWETYVNAVRDRSLTPATDTGDVVVLVDHERRRWNDLLDAIDAYDGVERTVLRVCHHQAAERLLGREVEGADPIVVRKPDSATAGQRFAEAVVQAALQAGASHEAAWAYYGVDVRGVDGREWADRCGYDDAVRVADAVESARAALGE